MLRRALNAHVSEILKAPTPLDLAPTLSEKLGGPVFLKREDLTPVFSFKLRGAYNRIRQLSAAEAKCGVIAASAGNHAQGVAYSCKKLGIQCDILMPRTTPRIKIDAVRRFGATIELVGDSYSDAAERCEQRAATEGKIVAAPFDDLHVIAGQATVALEVLNQAPRDTEAIFVPIGGGGLAAGVAAVVKAIRPQVKVIGVEPVDSNAMQQSIAAGRPITLAQVGIFADGVAVKRVGHHTYRLCQEYLDDIITVNTDQICAAIRDAFVDTRTVLEPAGALSIAGAKAWRQTRNGHAPIVAIASGANIAYQRFGYVVERAEIGEHREALLAVTIPEERGAFLQFVTTLGERTVTEFNYRANSQSSARIFLGVEVSGKDETEQLCRTLQGLGYQTSDLTQDELAKTHIRHMVGGRATHAKDEVFYEFVFPERPGALSEFLHSLNSQWNISLFHYRNHGAAYGRVLCGIEVPLAERSQLSSVLKKIGFPASDVTANPATAFLR